MGENEPQGVANLGPGALLAIFKIENEYAFLQKNKEAVSLVVLEKTFVLVSPIISQWKSMTLGWSRFGIQRHSLHDLFRVLLDIAIYTKQIRCGPHGSREVFPIILVYGVYCSPGCGQFRPSGLDLQDLCRNIATN